MVSIAKKRMNMKKKFPFSMVFSVGEFKTGRRIKKDTANFILVQTRYVIPVLSKFFSDTLMITNRIIFEKIVYNRYKKGMV